MFCRTILLQALIFAALLFPLGAAEAQNPTSAGNAHVQVKLISDRTHVQPEGVGEQAPAKLGVLFSVAPGWHIYWQNSGESAIPTRVRWNLPAGWRTGDLEWPAPQKFAERGNITTFGYQDEVLLMTDLFPLSEPAAGKEVTVEAEVRWLVCKDICVPGQATVHKKLLFSDAAPLEASQDNALFDRYQPLLPIAAAKVKQLTITPLVERQTAPAGSTVTGALHIQGLKITDPAKHLQFFPYGSDTFTLVHATASSLKDGSTIIRFPIEVSPDAAPGEYRAAGELVFADSVLQSSHDRSLRWELPLSVGSKSGPDAQFAALSKEAPEGAPLTFRLHAPSKEGAGEDDGDETQGAALGSPLGGQPAAGSDGLGYILLSAFLGGMLLNLMPCVLPIISIKVMGFVGAAEQEGTKGKLAAWAFSSGILATFLLLAAIVVLLRGLGFELGWGFQFQHPEFVLGLLLIVFLLGLGFFDVYSISLPYLQGANRAVSKLEPSLLKHFFDGVLATLLSTPCTAPFLAAALLAAFTQSAWVTFLVFATIGVGLALPYAYLSTHPKLLKMLPKPGPWMYRIRHLMGFSMLGTAVWLEFVLVRLSGTGALWSLVLLLLIYFGFWLYDWARESGSRRRGRLSAAVALVIIGFVGARWYPHMVGQPVEMRISWQDYSPEIVNAARESGQAVFIDFTAEWCITCKANETFTIETAPVAEALKEHNVLPVKADWTDGNELVTAALKSFGAEGVPLYVVLPADTEQEPLVLSTLPSRSSLIAALKQATILSR